MNKLLLDQQTDQDKEEKTQEELLEIEEYKKKITMFIELEKLKLVSKAVSMGAAEKEVCAMLD